MLVLTRQVGKRIIIGDDIIITIVAINGRQIRVGIDAPKDVTVHREEIYGKVLLEREAEEKGE